MTAARKTDFDRAVDRTLIASLRGQARRLTRDPVEADDLVQETLVRAFRFWSSFDGRDLRAWLSTIMRNTMINRYHRARTQADALPLVVAHVEATREDADLEHAADHRATDALTRARVRNAIARLPARYREVIMRADFEGMQYREIADALEIPIGTVMSRLHRGRRALAESLRSHAVAIGLVEYAASGEVGAA